MARKKKTDESQADLGEFDDWFADGESDSFWDDDKVDAFAQDEAPADAEVVDYAAEEAARKAAAEARSAEDAAKAGAEAKAAEEAARADAEAKTAAEAAAAEEAARAEAEAKAAAAEAAAAEAAAAEAAAAEAAAAEAAAAEAAAAEAAAAEAAAAEAAAADAAAEAAAAAARIDAEKARAAAAKPNPTLIADFGEALDEARAAQAEVEHEEADAETEIADRDDAGDSAIDGLTEEDDDEYDDEDELAATADDFVDAGPDASMVMRREAKAPPPKLLPNADEVAQARAEREARRAAASEASADSAAPAVRRTAPSVPSSHAADRWAEAAQALAHEADARVDDPPVAGALWAAAGRVHFERLGNWDRAEELFGRAFDTGYLESEYLKAFADVVANRGDFQRLRDLLVARAEASSGALSAEALQDAALVERNSLRRPEEAAALLTRAIEADDKDWFALRLLRELHYRTSSWDALLDVLDRMASLVSGPRAARLQVERGRIQEERLGDPDGALESFELALADDPGHTPAFLAVERIARARGDRERLAALYAAEAGRFEGADRAFWLARSLHAGRGSAEGSAADALRAAMDSSGVRSPELRHEEQVLLAAEGRWAEVATALEQEADATVGTERAWVLYRLARVQEQQLGDVDAAIDSYRGAAAADPSAGPAVEAAAGLLAGAGRFADLVALLESSLSTLDDPNLVVTTLYRMGEICEGPLANQEGARKWFERILDTAPGYLPALEGLERVYTRLEAWDRLAAVYEQRAILAEDPGAVALQLHRAGAVCEFRLADHARARDFYQRALDNVPDFPASLDAYVRILEAEGDWAGLARALRLASEATRDSNQVVSLTYRSARILADRVDDDAQAMDLLRRCLQLSPGFLPAIALLRELAQRSGAWQDVYDLHRLEADGAEDLERRHWRMLVAADVASAAGVVDPAAVASEVLDEDSAQVAALRLLEERALRDGDPHELLAVFQRRAFSAEDPAERTRLSVHIAELAAEAGDSVTAMNAVSEVISADDGDRPLASLARLAESSNYWEEAQRALVTVGDDRSRAELARIQEAWLDDASASRRTWQEILEAHPDDVEAAAGLERTKARLGEREGLAQAHAVLAQHLPDPAIAAVHALLAGHLFEANGELDEAVAYYERAFDARPVPGKAFDALRRVYTQRRQADALVQLFDRLETSSAFELATALEEAGAEAAAVERFRAVADGAGDDAVNALPALVRLEQDLVQLGAWKELFETLGRRLAMSASDEERHAIDARRRWVLAEHLADTDEAWDFYRQLHEEDPGDADVLEALARIAAARGETGLAIQYLGGLAEQATDPEAAARYQRRIAEAQLVAGDKDAARDALMRALDHAPADLDALALLKQLAEDAEDWRGLVGALAREATVLEGEAQVACYRRIASTWEERIGDEAVAADAWRKVLEVEADDVDALQHLVALARRQESWGALVEHGTALVPHLGDAERGALLGELGRVQLEQFHDEDEAIRLLDAATRGETPDLAAAQALEKLYAARGQWDRVSDAVIRQAHAAADDDRVGLLLRAAEIRWETLHDRAGAADVYVEILGLQPDHVAALRFVGDHNFELGQLAEAVQAYERLDGWEDDLDLDDFDDRMEAALHYFRFGEALRRLDDKEGALARYRQGLAFNTTHLPSLEAIGPILIEASDWDEAAKVYRQILQLIGGQGDSERLCRTYTNLGIIEQHQGKLDKAKKRFTKALDLKPNDVAALRGMATVLFARNDWNNLLNVYNNVIYHAVEPEDVVDAYLTKGFILDAKMGLPDKAAQHYEKSLAFNPAQPVGLLRLAELALRRQDWPEAASLADRGLGLDLSRKDLLAGLYLVKAVAHGACGDDAAARDAVSAAVAADVTLDAVLAKADGSAAALHEILKERLQSAP